MPLFRRVARRGFSNVRFRTATVALGLDQLEAAFADGDVVDQAALIGRGLIAEGVDAVKILANGSLTRKLEVRLGKVSAAARSAIEAAGGSVVAASEEAPAQPKAVAEPAAGDGAADDGVDAVESAAPAEEPDG